MIPDRTELILWRWIGWRHARQDWKQSLLLILALSLGVATFIGIRIANRSAVDGFQSFTDSVSGQSDWILRAPSGHLPTERLPAIRNALGVLPVDLVPVIETQTIRWTRNTPDNQTDARPVPLLGIDLVALQNLSARSPSEQIDIPQDALNADSNLLFISRPLAALWKVQPGDHIELLLSETPQLFEIAAILPQQRGGIPIPPRLLLMDLPALQSLIRQGNFVDRVEVSIAATHNRAALIEETGKILTEAATLADGTRLWTIESSETEKTAGADMTAAFRMNLTILSLISLMVGIYLILQALDAAVTRRRQEIAILRSLGFSPAMIQRAWLVEAALFGLAAALGGILLGVLFAQFSAEAIARTVSTLYRPTLPPPALPILSDFAWALALGLGGGVIAGWIPARDAATTPPAQMLRNTAIAGGYKLLLPIRFAILCLLIGFICALLPPAQLRPGVTFPLGGYLAAFLWLTGSTLLGARLIQPIGRALHLIPSNTAWYHYATSRLAHATSRHQLAVAGFAIASGMAASMGFLISSFETTIVRWLETRFQADAYLSSAGFQGSSTENRLRAETWLQIENLPEVATLDPFRNLPIQINGQLTFLGASRLHLIDNPQEYLWLDPPQHSYRNQNPATAYINEAFSARFGYQTGDAISIETPKGILELQIEGRYADYGSERGTLLIDFEVMKSWYNTADVTNLSIWLQPGSDIDDFAEKIRTSYPGISIRANRQLKEAALDIFYQTFSLTRALQWIGLSVALFGLILTIIGLLRDSRSELYTLRRLGLRQREVARACMLEGAVITLAGIITGTTLSLALGWLLIAVINKQSFGWTLQMNYPLPEIAITSLLLTIIAATISFLIGTKTWK